MKDESIFPNIEVEDVNKQISTHSPYGGLTKRELFAAIAMQGLITNSADIYSLAEKRNDKLSAICSDLSVKYADALIKKLKEVPSDES